MFLCFSSELGAGWGDGHPWSHRAWRRGMQSQGEQRMISWKNARFLLTGVLRSKVCLCQTRRERGSFLELLVFGQTHTMEIDVIKSHLQLQLWLALLCLPQGGWH